MPSFSSTPSLLVDKQACQLDRHTLFIDQTFASGARTEFVTSQADAALNDEAQ